jgi:restriction system protein
MAKIGVQRQGELLRSVLEVLAEEGQALPARDVLQRVESRTALTEHEAGDYPSGVRRFDRIVRFATISSVKAGWLIKNKGHWSITDEGEAALARYPDPGDLIREAGRLYRKWKKTTLADHPDEEIDDVDSLAASSTTLEEAQEAAWDEISSHVSGMNPADVEAMVGALMEAMGYHVGWRATGGPDGGVDLIAHNDPLGTTKPRIKVQVKRKQDRVGAEMLRSFLGVLSQDDVGIFVSTGGFSNEAVRLARDEPRQITLVGLRALFDLWTEYYDRVPEEQKDLLPLTEVYFLTPDD